MGKRGTLTAPWEGSRYFHRKREKGERRSGKKVEAGEKKCRGAYMLAAVSAVKGRSLRTTFDTTYPPDGHDL